MDLPLASLIAIGAITIVAGAGLLYWTRVFREKKLAEVQALLERPIVLRPGAQPAPESGPRAEEPGEAFRFVMLFTDMVKKLSAARSGEEIPSVLVRTIGNLIGAPSVAYFAFEEEAGLLRLVEGRGLPAGLMGELAFPLGQGKIGFAAEKGLVMEERDFEWEMPLDKRRIQALPSQGVPTTYCAPMIHQERLFGLMSVAEPGYRSPHLKKLLSAVADLAAISLHNAHLLGRFAHRAETDGLTGLTTRRSFAHHLAEEVVRCRNYGDPLSLLMLDVDHFKHYNDTNGHPAGDEVLRGVADVLRKSFRKTDMVARYGGEEFVVIMSGLQKDQAYALADRVRVSIQNIDFPHGAGQPLGRVTISAGVATFPQDAATGDELLSSADRALYDAKRAGRNRVVQYQSGELSGEGEVLQPAGPSGRSAVLEAFLAGAADRPAEAEVTPEEGGVTRQPRTRVIEHRPSSPIAPNPHFDEYWES